MKSKKMIEIDHIEIVVANLAASVDFYQKTLQFKPIASSEKEEKSSILMQLGSIRIVLTSFKNSFYHPAKQEVKQIAFQVDDVDIYFDNVSRHDVEIISSPQTFVQNNKKIRIAAVNSLGNLIHLFIEREKDAPYFLPDFVLLSSTLGAKQTLDLSKIDHIAICVPQGDLPIWKEYYQRIYGWQQSYEEYVQTENSGMNSVVMQADNAIQFVFVEPATGKQQSQIEDYLKFYNGPCVQHIAFLTNDIINSVKKLRENGMEFLAIPNQYYQIQREKLKNIALDFQEIQEQAILVDKDEMGLLYQIFSKSSQPTLFFEFTQRINCKGFGSGNIRALFQAIEQEQLKRETIDV